MTPRQRAVEAIDNYRMELCRGVKHNLYDVVEQAIKDQIAEEFVKRSYRKKVKS